MGTLVLLPATSATTTLRLFVRFGFGSGTLSVVVNGTVVRPVTDTVSSAPPSTASIWSVTVAGDALEKSVPPTFVHDVHVTRTVGSARSRTSACVRSEVLPALSMSRVVTVTGPSGRAAPRFTCVLSGSGNGTSVNVSRPSDAAHRQGRQH